MLETTRIRREGFSARFDYEVFVANFRVLALHDRDPIISPEHATRTILDHCGISGYQMGFVWFLFVVELIYDPGHL
jgi:myosin heavy subunit